MALLRHAAAPAPSHWQQGSATTIGVCAGPALGLVVGDVPLGFAVGLALGAGADGVLGLLHRGRHHHDGSGAPQGPGPA